MKDKFGHGYDDGPTTCFPTEAVVKNVKQEIQASRAL